MSYTFLKINAPFRSYIRKFDAPLYENLSYQELKEVLEWEAVFLNGSWAYYLRRLGHVADEINPTVRPLQMKWAEEHGLTVDPDSWKLQIALEQIKSFKPEVVYSTDWDMPLLKTVRAEVPSVKFVIGVFGSYIPPLNGWEVCDCIVSPAPEAVQQLKEKGFPAVHLHKGVDPRWLERVKAVDGEFDLAFAGALLLTPGTHRNRVQALDAVIAGCPNIRVGIFTDERQISEHLKKFTGQGLRSKIKQKLTRILGSTSRQEDMDGRQEWGIEKRAIRRIVARNRGPVYGIDMLGVFQQSKLVFNSHASSSPTHASNFRLFEATLAGACLVTDWKENLPDLFEPDKEVVTYRSAGEAVDKIQYLLGSDGERRAIAEAGHARTLRDHTLDRRAEELDGIVRRLMKGQLRNIPTVVG